MAQTPTLDQFILESIWTLRLCGLSRINARAYVLKKIEDESYTAHLSLMYSRSMIRMANDDADGIDPELSTRMRLN